jgi:hypothetical protein
MLMIAFIVSMMFWRTSYENNEISRIDSCVLSGAVDNLFRRTRRPNEQNADPKAEGEDDKPERERRSFFVGIHIISYLSFNRTNH